MAAPQWITKAGSLGIAVELEPFSVNLAVQTGDARAQFAVISGQLPPGLRLTPQGNISGYPIGKLSGIPLAVNEEIVFTFVVRCKNERGEIADRTFSITVTGQDAPIPVAAPYANNSLGSFNDGEWVEIDIAALDTDPNDVLTYRIVSGSLPTGLALDTVLGKITGYIEPSIFLLSSVGFDTDNFDSVGFSQESSLSSRTYNFEIQIDDSKTPVIASYNITVNKEDNHTPILLNRSTDIGTVLDENYFFHKFDARDFDNDELNFEILPIVKYPTIVGTAVYPTLTANGNLAINGETITLSGNTVGSVSDDINSAATYLGNLTNISSEVRNGKLLIFSTGAANSTITIGNTLAASELGINVAVYTRNVNDTNLDITQDLTEIIPTNLQLNANTGWLYGFIDPITVGEKTYDFYLRVYELDNAIGSSITVDYASEFPFNIVNNKAQDQLDELGLDVDNTDYVNKTIVFAQQESFDATYTGLDDTVFTTGASNGWIDPNSVVISTTPNKRGGVWKFVKTVNRTVINGNTVGNVELTMNNVNTLVIGMTVTGTNIAANTVISSINTTSNIITLNAAISGTISANSVINFNSSNYQLDFVQTINNGTYINVNRYTTTGNSGYTQPGVRLYYETTATPPNTQPRYVVPSTVEETANSSLWPQRLTVTSSNNYQIQWITDSDLGLLTSGIPSKTVIQATNLAKSKIEYQLAFVHSKTVFGNYNQATVIRLRDVDGIVTGLRLRTADQNYTALLPAITAINQDLKTIQLSYPITLANDTVVELVGTDLPRGLRLTSNGEIQGRPSHQYWKLNDNTTFDSNETTFDRTYIIPVRAVSYLNDPAARQIESVKTFKLTVQDFKDKPSTNLYLDFLLEENDRQILSQALYNDHIVPDEHVYRADDHWFGRQDRMKMLVAYGLDTATAQEIVAATAAYHHKKRYRFTELKWAQSVDANGQIEYEVIYIDPIDDFTLNNGVQLTGNINVLNLSIPIKVDNNNITADESLISSSSTVYDYLYPASLSNMQSQLKAELTPNNRRFLPSWMTSKQPNLRVLNYVQAIPLVYMKPGTGKNALFKLQQLLSVNEVHALTDRYYWDNGLSENYDNDSNRFVDDPLTTFDQEEFDDAQYTVNKTVDFAVDTPFFQVNNARASDLKRLGILDGYRGDINGKTLIFYRQENYTSLNDFQAFDGWAKIVPQYDDIFDSGFETYEVVTGKEILYNLPATPWANFTAYSIGDIVEYQSMVYICVRAHNNNYSVFTRDFFVPATSATTDQRTGIWRIIEDNMGFVLLEFVEEIPYGSSTPPYSISPPYNSVRIRSGIKYGGSIVSLVPPSILGVGFTVPGYINQADVISQTENGTIFDSSTTEFFNSNTDRYQEMDQGAKYIVFRKQNFLDQGTVDV